MSNTHSTASYYKTYYGKTKLKGEIAIRNINPKDSIIIRTSWLFSNFGKNFVMKMIKLANEKKQIKEVLKAK